MRDEQRGVLYPEHLPEFHRVAPSEQLVQAVRWFWIPEWDLPAGSSSHQQVLPFPACNLVVESTARANDDGAEPLGPHTFGSVTAVGPPTRRSERILTGSGWAVGALLLPAAAPSVIADLAALRDSTAVLDEPELLAGVGSAMSDRTLDGNVRRARAVAVFEQWIASRLPDPSPQGIIANHMADALADPSITRVDQLPERLHVSARTVQRIAERFFGLSPHSMIRRRRLQEAAQRLRDDPDLPLAELADELGYADHAHFTNDFHAVLGIAPTQYRAGSASA